MEKMNVQTIDTIEGRLLGFEPPEAFRCPHCGREMSVFGVLVGGKPYWRRQSPAMCECDGNKAEQRRIRQEEREREFFLKEKERKAEAAKHTQAADRGSRFKARTFDAFIADTDNIDAYGSAKALADNFGEYRAMSGRNGLWLVGGMGTGKTHLAVAIVNGIDSRFSALYMTEQEMYQRAKELMTTDDNFEFYTLLKTVSLLILDDVGKEKPGEWGVSLLFDIINARYEHSLPTVITSNYGGDSLTKRLTVGDNRTTAAALVDRLFEMCEVRVLQGKSRRRR